MLDLPEINALAYYSLFFKVLRLFVEKHFANKHYVDMRVKLWSAKSNGREPTCCSGQVFNSKLGGFAKVQRKCVAFTQTLPDLRT